MNYIRKIPTENLRVRATKELTALHLLGAFHQNIFYFFNLRRRRLSGIKNRCASYGNQVLISNFAWYPYPRYIYTVYIYSIYIQYIYIMETVCLKLEPVFCWLAYGCVMACLEMGAPKTFSPFKLPFAKACMTKCTWLHLIEVCFEWLGLKRVWPIPMLNNVGTEMENTHQNCIAILLFIEKMWSKHWMVRYPFAKPTKGKTELQLQRARRQAPCHMDQRAHGAIHPFDVGGGSKVCPQWPKPSETVVFPHPVRDGYRPYILISSAVSNLLHRMLT